MIFTKKVPAYVTKIVKTHRMQNFQNSKQTRVLFFTDTINFAHTINKKELQKLEKNVKKKSNQSHASKHSAKGAKKIS